MSYGHESWNMTSWSGTVVVTPASIAPSRTRCKRTRSPQLDGGARNLERGPLSWDVESVGSTPERSDFAPSSVGGTISLIEGDASIGLLTSDVREGPSRVECVDPRVTCDRLDVIDAVVDPRTACFLA
jgi:hypothetical protein